MIDIGRYSDRVTIQTPREVRGRSGQTTLEWSASATVWAEVNGLSSRDIMQAQQANVVASHRIRIRKRDDVSHTHRVIWKSRTMEIASVTERGETTEILAKELT